MAFTALSFIFDNIPCETYGLFLISKDGNGVLENMGSSSVELYTQKVYRKPKPYLFGVEQAPVLQFELSFASLEPLSADDQRAIQRWLFGHNQYKKLQIQQCDYYNYYFNCILTDPVITTIGNLPYQFTCTVICDAPWAWEFPRTISIPNNVYDYTYVYNNISDNNDYTYPYITFTTNTTTNTVQVINKRDNNSGFTMRNINTRETITMDGEHGIITSSTGLLRFENFSGNFLRLLPGLNPINILGITTQFKMTVHNARKVSG